MPSDEKDLQTAMGLLEKAKVEIQRLADKVAFSAAHTATLTARLEEEEEGRYQIAQALGLPACSKAEDILPRIEAILDCEQQNKDRAQEAKEQPTVSASGFLTRVNLIAQLLGLPAGRTYLLDEIEGRIKELRESDVNLGQIIQALGLPPFANLAEILDRVRRLQEGQDRTQKYIIDEATKTQLGRIAELEADRRALALALEMSATMSLDGLTGKIGYLLRDSAALSALREKGIVDDDSLPLAASALPRPADLPAEYAFEVAGYIKREVAWFADGGAELVRMAKGSEIKREETWGTVPCATDGPQTRPRTVLIDEKGCRYAWTDPLGQTHSMPRDDPLGQGQKP